MSAYAITVRTELGLADAEARVRDELSSRGFGILTEIDVAATLLTKLGIERPAYKILGACNPSLAKRALEADPSIGVLLPCNVVVRDEDGATVIAAIEPDTMSQLSPSPDVVAIAAEVRQHLVAALEAVAS